MSGLSVWIERTLKEASTVSNVETYGSWRRKVDGALRRLDPDLNTALKQIGDEYLTGDWRRQLEHQCALLEGTLLDLDPPEPAPAASNRDATPKPLPGSRVFVVHGRDEAAKEGVARFLEHLGLQAVILHEQANESKAVLEKLEAHSSVAFAVVLLTPDDLGASGDAKLSPQPRARQNVIFELGYFIAKLGRGKVCALYKPGVELPSDYVGIVYVEFDAHGAWRTKLAQELVQAGLNIKLDALLKR